jgi:hypothetical protein
MQIDIIPGALVSLGETVSILTSESCRIRISRPDWAKEQAMVVEGPCPTSGLVWTPGQPGSYTVECSSESGRITRYIGVVAPGWAVCQMTVGAFTAEDFSETVHSSRVPVDYYITLHQAPEPRWRAYEQLYGDAIHPHTQADQLGIIDASLKHKDSNWETLPYSEIVRRLRGLQDWWRGLGFLPLDRIASYTPCNSLVTACKEVGIRILHSVIPEQNWSDGEWAINHWGMPTCPFWMADDDFRKPGTRTADGVLAMTMNHYHVLLPHLTHWGDFVLSPSHFLRWNRASDSGDHPVRFEQLVRDTIAMADQQAEHPVFFVAGFEFGRTFGTSKMTDYNRKGIQALISLAADQPMVFATSRNVLSYYERHIETIPERILHQRDIWAGARTMGKPGVVEDCVVLERADYKAVIRDGNPLPWMHYDYQLPWHYPTAATNVPEDWAEHDNKALCVEKTADALVIKSETPLARAVPVVAWDSAVTDSPWKPDAVPALDNNRRHSLIEVPQGWCGEQRIRISACRNGSSAPRPPWWQTKTQGAGGRRCTYLHLDLPLLRNVEIPFDMCRGARVDGHQAPIGQVPSGYATLTFGPHKTWYRFWGLEADEIAPTEATVAAVLALQPGIDLLAEAWEEQLAAHLTRLHDECLSQQGWAEDDVLLEVACGARLPLGSRSRAAEHDIVTRNIDGLSAHEYSDGAIAYGPGKSFWCHPRGLNVKVQGLNAIKDRGPLAVVLHSFDAVPLDARYRVTIGHGRVHGRWALPTDPWSPEAWYRVAIDPSWISPSGVLSLGLLSDQKGVLYDWWEERGFVAGLHALWVGRNTQA